MSRRVWCAALAGVVLLLLPLRVAQADDDGNDYNRNPNWSPPKLQARVESRSDGVYVQIEGRQSVPGIQQPAAPADPGPPPPAARPAPSTTSAAVGSSAAPATSAPTSSSGDQGRTWVTDWGIFHQTPDGHLTQMIPPNIGNASADYWHTELNNHPNQNPWLVYQDQQFVDIVWLPRSSDPNNVNFGAPPADTPPQTTAAPANGAGGGVNIDPREVALDVLDHVPMPDVHVRMNPSLGLVAMPGWFWVEGYDGRPFGLSRTVTVPPAVGADVPVDVVPADDSRRRGSSVTVDVQVWASRYAWSFGDGASQVTQSLGRPYPAESDIKHTYEHSSLQLPNGFPVQLTVEFDAEFRVNGGPAQALPPIRRTYEADYRVQEMQPVLTNR